MGLSIKRWLWQRSWRDADRPTWWQATPPGPVVFHPSLRTAAELVAADAQAVARQVSSRSAA